MDCTQVSMTLEEWAGRVLSGANQRAEKPVAKLQPTTCVMSQICGDTQPMADPVITRLGSKTLLINKQLKDLLQRGRRCFNGDTDGRTGPNTAHFKTPQQPSEFHQNTMKAESLKCKVLKFLPEQ